MNQFEIHSLKAVRTFNATDKSSALKRASV